MRISECPINLPTTVCWPDSRRRWRRWRCRRRQGKDRRRRGWRITYRRPCSPPPIFFTSCSSRLLPRSASSSLVALQLLLDLRFHGFWLVEMSLVTPCPEKESIFFCSFCTPDYVFCESDSISCHGLKYQISCMLDYPICESVSILCLGIRYQISCMSDCKMCESD